MRKITQQTMQAMNEQTRAARDGSVINVMLSAECND